MCSNELMLLVGIDAGGSKIHIQIESVSDGMLLVDDVHDSTDWISLNGEQRGRVLLDRVVSAAHTFGKVAVVVAGVHGNDSPEQEVILGAPLAEFCPLVRILNDSHLLILAHGKSSGTGLIAGTGSSVTATVGKKTLTVGGWGWLFGDEGGAAGLVRDTAKAALDIYDRGETDPFIDDFLAWFSLDSPHGLEYLFSSTEPRFWAKAAPLIFSAAEQGSIPAQKIINDHALALAHKVALLKSRGGDVSTIVCAGGVIVNQPLLFDAFTREVRHLVGDDIQTSLLYEAPVVGALNHARHLYRMLQQGIPHTPS